MSTYIIYYLEVNLICITVLTYVLFTSSKDNSSTDVSRHFKWIIYEIMAYCILDIIAAVCRNMNFPGVRGVLYVTNSLFIAVPITIAESWERYIVSKMEPYGYKKHKGQIFISILAFLSILMVLSSPFNGFTFYLDENNIYHRATGFGAYFAPLVGWIYLTGSSLRLLLFKLKKDTVDGRIVKRSLVLFGVPPLIASGCQVAMYGSTISQVGFTISLLSIFLTDLNNQVSRDSLTGIRNRREYNRFIDKIGPEDKKLTVCMIDMDRFKSVNDKYGHAEGDAALKMVADFLNIVCKKVDKESFLARYGGDEFVIVGKNKTSSFAENLQKEITEGLVELNNNSNLKYPICLSFGFSEGEIINKEDITRIVLKADSLMYEMKNRNR